MNKPKATNELKFGDIAHGLLFLFSGGLISALMYIAIGRGLAATFWIGWVVGPGLMLLGMISIINVLFTNSSMMVMMDNDLRKRVLCETYNSHRLISIH